MEAINRTLRRPDGRLYVADLPLFVERARLHAALGHWKDAEDALALLFRYQASLPMTWAEAYLLRGYLRERRGDKDGALADWRLAWAEVKKARAELTLPGSMAGTLAGRVRPPRPTACWPGRWASWPAPPRWRRCSSGTR